MNVNDHDERSTLSMNASVGALEELDA
jgi:hypothetical protein